MSPSLFFFPFLRQGRGEGMVVLQSKTEGQQTYFWNKPLLWDRIRMRVKSTPTSLSLWLLWRLLLRLSLLPGATRRPDPYRLYVCELAYPEF